MADLLKLENQICFPVYSLAKEITNQYRTFLNKIDLTYPQYLVMLVLWEYKEQTVTNIGDKLRLDSGTLTPLLKRLEQKGLVSRSRSTSDERVVNITLTKAGEELKAKVKNLPKNMMASLQLPMEELKALKESVERILKIIYQKNENT
jgi:DNA-binding MarR family transcriptional regulator